MHVHNNYRTHDQHNSVLKGTVNFDHTFRVFDKLGIAPILSTEVFEKNALLESLDYLEEKMKSSSAYNP
jgi:sugar phosphate isomerase/epimerase